MELVFSKKVTVRPADFNHAGKFKLSALLYYVQEISGGHCASLECDWDTLAAKGMFWAVLRHRAVIHRLPEQNEEITLETWPLPMTRVAYPRAVRALDSKGEVLFEAMSLWVLMDRETRAMILPAKSGVDVPGVVRDMEIATPPSLGPGCHEKNTLWQVTEGDLDQNRHVNNTVYLDRAEQLTGSFGANVCPKEFTVCYLSEVRLGEEITLGWTGCEGDMLTLDGTRSRPDDSGKTERVFAAKLIFS